MGEPKYLLFNHFFPEKKSTKSCQKSFDPLSVDELLLYNENFKTIESLLFLLIFKRDLFEMKNVGPCV